MYVNYPKDAYGNDMPGPDAYQLVGGNVLAMYQSNPAAYSNACALRVSRALNYSGVSIPKQEGTFKGADGKYYFLSSQKLYDYMTATFGAPDMTLTKGDFSAQLQGNQGIYIMQASYPGQFGALGHATLFTGTYCIGGHCYFNASGGVYKIGLWKLN